MPRAPKAVVAAAALAAACGGSRPTTPTSSPTPEPGIPAGSVVTIVSGETGRPVAGATVLAHGTSYMTDETGRITLAQLAPLGALVDVLDAGHLDRQTSLRSSAQPPLSLWPRHSETGLDDELTSTLVYTDTDEDAPHAGAPLVRLPEATTRVALVPSPQLRDDAEAMAWQVRSAEAITAATGGRVVYEVAPQTPGSGLAVDVRYDPSHEDCDDARAFCRVRSRGGEIVTAEIVYCVSDARYTGTVVHELGHTFGLQHGPDSREVMFRHFSRRRATGFSEREALAMRLMLQRRAGNRFPDNDRSATAAGVTGEHRIVCR